MSEPINELQPMIDHLERSYGDEDPYGYDPDEYDWDEE